METKEYEKKVLELCEWLTDLDPIWSYALESKSGHGEFSVYQDNIVVRASKFNSDRLEAPHCPTWKDLLIQVQGYVIGLLDWHNRHHIRMLEYQKQGRDKLETVVEALDQVSAKLLNASSNLVNLAEATRARYDRTDTLFGKFSASNYETCPFCDQHGGVSQGMDDDDDIYHCADCNAEWWITSDDDDPNMAVFVVDRDPAGDRDMVPAIGYALEIDGDFYNFNIPDNSLSAYLSELGDAIGRDLDSGDLSEAELVMAHKGDVWPANKQWWVEMFSNGEVGADRVALCVGYENWIYLNQPSHMTLGQIIAEVQDLTGLEVTDTSQWGVVNVPAPELWNRVHKHDLIHHGGIQADGHWPQLGQCQNCGQDTTLQPDGFYCPDCFAPSGDEDPYRR